MRRRTIPLAIALALALAAADIVAGQQAPPRNPERERSFPSAVDASRSQRLEMLVRHGVDERTQSLIRFLENGFDLERLPAGLPRRPEIKSELLTAVIMELADRRATEAIPVLERLAIRDVPEGTRSVMNMDFERVPIAGRSEQVRTMERALSLNAVVALGRIGDERAAPTILRVMRSESGTAFTTLGALALGRMGRADGLPALMLLAEEYESPDSVEAFRTIYYLTGRNYGYHEFTAKARRRVLLAQLLEWYEGEGKNTEVRRADVQRRVQAPPQREAVDPRSLRGALRDSANFGSFEARYEARTRLESMAGNRFDDLRAIAEDPYEDLDIRRAAMTWLSAVDARRARSIIRRQRNDENTLIAEFARSLEEDVDEAIAFERRNR